MVHSLLLCLQQFLIISGMPEQHPQLVGLLPQVGHKFLIASPSHHIECLSELIVVSVWRWSFASPCHVANSNKSLQTMLSWGGDNRPSKTGIEH